MISRVGTMALCQVQLVESQVGLFACYVRLIADLQFADCCYCDQQLNSHWKKVLKAPTGPKAVCCYLILKMAHLWQLHIKCCRKWWTRKLLTLERSCFIFEEVSTSKYFVSIPCKKKFETWVLKTLFGWTILVTKVASSLGRSKLVERMSQNWSKLSTNNQTFWMNIGNLMFFSGAVDIRVASLPRGRGFD